MRFSNFSKSNKRIFMFGAACLIFSMILWGWNLFHEGAYIGNLFFLMIFLQSASCISIIVSLLRELINFLNKK